MTDSILGFFNPFYDVIRPKRVLNSSIFDRFIDTFRVFYGKPYGDSQKRYDYGKVKRSDIPYFFISDEETHYGEGTYLGILDYLLFPLALIDLILPLGFLRILAYGIGAVALTLAVSPIIGIVHGICCLINYINEKPSNHDHEKKIQNTSKDLNNSTIDKPNVFHASVFPSNDPIGKNNNQPAASELKYN